MTHDKDLTRQLDGIAVLEYDSHEALLLAHRLRPDDQDNLQRFYEALRMAVWHLLALQTYGTEMNRWHDVLRQVAALHPFLSERVRVLSDLVLTSGRFGLLAYGYGEEGKAPHVQEILAAVRKHGGSLSLAQASAATGIAYGFMLQITNNMAALGIIDKKGYGGEAVLSLPFSKRIPVDA